MVGTYKKEETGVEPIVAYNKNGKKLDRIFADRKDGPAFLYLTKKEIN